jgi:hypothetical protein
MPVATASCDTPTTTDDLWTVQKTAAFLRVSKHTLAHWRSHGKGPRFFHMANGRGGKVYYRTKDIDEWLARVPVRQGWDEAREA